ncbi:MAG: hypothetical protein AB8G96_14060 [Phycisphaerales bacterium]
MTDSATTPNATDGRDLAPAARGSARGRRHSVARTGTRTRARLAGTMLLATTAAAVVAGSIAAGGIGLGRSAQRDAVAAVLAVMVLERMAVPAEAPAIVAGPASAGEPAATIRVPRRPASAAPECHRLGPHRLNLPPPAA